MAKVVFPTHLQRYTDGTRELEVDAASFRALVRKLDTRFPGIEDVLLEKVAVAIDGEITQEPLLESIDADSEVHFLERIGGG